MYVNWVHNKWAKEFSGQRLKRTAKSSPSNKQRPDLIKFDDAQAHILAQTKKYKAFDTCELVEDVKSKQKGWRENKHMQEKSKALPFEGLESDKAAEKLDMDHNYICFTDFLWGFLFIGPMSYCCGSEAQPCCAFEITCP